MEKKTWTTIINFGFEFTLLAFIATVVLELLKPGIVTRVVNGEVVFSVFFVFLILRLFDAKKEN